MEVPRDSSSAESAGEKTDLATDLKERTMLIPLTLTVVDVRSQTVPEATAHRPSSPNAFSCDKEADDAAVSQIERLGNDLANLDHLVVMPTETVYGLGANALSRTAVLRIFEAKKRPLSDPVICHVKSFEQAWNSLVDCTPVEGAAFQILADAFWPGPLSIACRASPNVPTEVTADTGFVAIRNPKHPVAQKLIAAADVPIAAPSANRFGHISPSDCAHVIRSLTGTSLEWKHSGDLALSRSVQRVLHVLDAGPFSVGIESTVCKIEEVPRSRRHPSSERGVDSSEEPLPPLRLRVTVLRRGAITVKDLRDALIRGAESLEWNKPPGKQYAVSPPAVVASLSCDAVRRALLEPVVRLDDSLETLNRQMESSARALAAQPPSSSDSWSTDTDLNCYITGPCHSKSAVATQVASGSTTTSTSTCTGLPSQGPLHKQKAATVVSGDCEQDKLHCMKQLSAKISTGCSPGMLLSHYAPDVPTFLLQRSSSSVLNSTAPRGPQNEFQKNFFFCVELFSNFAPDLLRVSCAQVAGTNDTEPDRPHTDAAPLSGCILLDAFGIYSSLRTVVGTYISLTDPDGVSTPTQGHCRTENDDPDGSRSAITALQHCFFSQLHAAEAIAAQTKSAAILIANFYPEAAAIGDQCLAVYDRAFRACAGKTARLAALAPRS